MRHRRTEKESNTAVSRKFAFALEAHTAGDIVQARELYRAILDDHPTHADTLHMLGVIAHQDGDRAGSLRLLGRSAALKPGVPEVHYNLGTILAAGGEIEKAQAAFRQATALNPAYLDAQMNLGIACLQLGRTAEAAVCFKKVVQLRPNYARGHWYLGNALSGFSLAESVGAYERAIALDPTFAEAYDRLGRVLMRLARFHDAERVFRTLLAVDRGYPDAHFNLGNALLEQTMLAQAAEQYQAMLDQDGGNPKALCNLAHVCIELGRTAAGLELARKAAARMPDLGVTHAILGRALLLSDRRAESVMELRRSISMEPAAPGAYSNLAQALAQQGHYEEAVLALSKAVIISNFTPALVSNLLYLLQYCHLPVAGKQVDRALLRRLHGAWERLISPAENPSGQRFLHVADPARRLRIGFVSADLGRHPVGFFLRGVLPHLDRELLDIFCYSDRVVEDEITAELKTAADHWCFTAQMTTSQLVRRIKSDRIDILVDLSGHTAKNRLPVFARRAAPVQVSWAGYAGTTGLSQMDYLIADARHVPAGEEADYSEQIERLPETYVCYAPPDYAPEVSELPALARGYVTFGCFNNLMKVNRSVVAAWARILAAIPSARLVLKTRELADANVCGEYAHRFAELGIDPSRVDLLGPSCHADLLAHYGEIDIALDPFPYSGGLTTLEALWMGVPVITLRGSTFAGRHSASHLGVVGLDEWIAADSEEYKQRAIALAGHPDLLAAIRRTLRRRLLESPLCDGKSFARELETACRRMWTAWCNKGVQKDCLAASAASGEIRKVAVITPYYRESVQVLRRCHESVLGQSVPCTHFMIADGQPSEHVGGWQVRHLVLPESHNDNGNTPRTAGTVAAIEEGFDAIACLDADNWFYPDHLQRMIALHRRTGAAVCTAGRSVHNSEGRQLLQRTARDESDGTEFVDTSCLFLTREAFRIAPLWSAMPAESGPYCDRIFWRAVRREGLATAHSPEPTVAFVSQYAAHYERAGEPVPVGSKTAADMAMRLATVGEPASWEESLRYLGAAFGAINLGDPKNETI